MPSPLLEFDRVTKTFGSVRASDEVSFGVNPGRIHALIGENGAGKSTLMKMLFGLERPDSGRILLRGQGVRISSPQDAKALGIGMVHQHFQLAAAMTALDHILLEESGRSGKSPLAGLKRASVAARMQELSRIHGMPVPWDARIDSLTVGVQQRIEILKLLALKSDILILDEPTAVLTPREVDQFLARLKDLRESGKTILLITHKLREVLAVADEVTVLRQGRVVFTGPLQGETVSSLAGRMVGGEFMPRDFRREPSGSEPRLRVRDLTVELRGRTALEDLSFDVRRGEIVGVAGVEGNGQSELLRALARPTDPAFRVSGSIVIDGADLTREDNETIRRRGVGFIPEDRLRMGAVAGLSVRENYQLGRTDLVGRFRLRARERDHELAGSILRYSVSPTDADLPFAAFSGGNQQKIVLARELGAKPSLLVVAQPTRGVDIGSIEAIHGALIDERNRGVGILLVSSELEELLRLSDRILVFFKGRIQAELARSEFDLERIGSLMGGGA